MKRKTVIIGLILMTAALILAGCSASEKAGGTDKQGTGPQAKPVLKIGYLPITHSLPLVVADKLSSDTYQNFRLELVKFSSWPELTEALNSGQIQGAITMLELAMVSAERGVPLQVLALSHRNGDSIITANDVNSIGDLKGQRVAIPHRISGHNILLYQALKNNGLTLDDVQWVEMPPPDMPAALAQENIKGFVVAEPFGAKAVLGGYGKVLLKAEEIWPNWICCGLVMNREFKEKNSPAVQELVDSLVGAGQYISEHQDEAVAIAQDSMKIDQSAWTKSFEWGISYTDLTPAKEELARLQDYLTELKLLKKPVEVNQLLDSTFVMKAYDKGK